MAAGTGTAAVGAFPEADTVVPVTGPYCHAMRVVCRHLHTGFSLPLETTRVRPQWNGQVGAAIVQWDAATPSTTGAQMRRGQSSEVRVYANFKNRKLVGQVGVVVASGEAPGEAGLEAAHGALAVSVAQ